MPSGKIELCPEKGYRLSWFVSGLFFPFYALASRVISLMSLWGKYSHLLFNNRRLLFGEQCGTGTLMKYED